LKRFLSQYRSKEGVIPMPHDFRNAPEPEWREFIIDHLERMADNQMNSATKSEEGFNKITTRLDTINGSVARSKERLAVHDNTLKWLWVCGSLVVSGIGIAMGVLWERVF
jgi:hypothetical protein